MWFVCIFTGFGGSRWLGALEGGFNGFGGRAWEFPGSDYIVGFVWLGFVGEMEGFLPGE